MQDQSSEVGGVLVPGCFRKVSGTNSKDNCAGAEGGALMYRPGRRRGRRNVEPCTVLNGAQRVPNIPPGDGHQSLEKAWKR